MRFEKFTTLAQESISAAQSAASAAGNPEITPLHLLAAMLAEKSSSTSGLLLKAGIDPVRTRDLAEAALRRLPKVQGAATGNASRDLVEVLNTAEREAQKMKDAYTSTEHLMLALRMRDGLASSEVHDKGWCGRTVDAGLMDAGLIDAAALVDGRIVLTRDGLLFADRLVRELIG